MILWIIFGIFMIISILLLMGKGSFLIAGYNTATQKDKQKYDEMKLCRVMGIGMGVIALGLLATILLQENGMFVMMGCILVGILIMFLGTNFCYSAEYQNEIQKQPHQSWYKNKNVLKSLPGIVVVIVVGVLMFVGSISVSCDHQSMRVGATLTKSMDISYQDITSIEYLEEYDTGSKSFGINNMVIEAGQFKNETFGTYHLYAYNQCDDYIAIHTQDEIIVMNQKTSEKTKELYQTIQSHMKK